MQTDHREALARIRRFDQLVAYLRDELDWPISDWDFEDLTFEYDPKELGIDPKNAAKIKQIRRLRPLIANQPWGIFFLEFEPGRLPVVALRRVLSQVVLKKRASANVAEHRAWAVDDLLFVSNYGEGDERQISFAHFSSPQGGHDLPTLKVLGWDNLDTALHLDAVAKDLAEHLSWPADETDVEAWRMRWSAAFTLRNREVITTSKELSIHLAELARRIRDLIQTALGVETQRGPLTTLMKAFKTALVHDLDGHRFADMYAQTIAYGLLSARIADPQRKTADDFAGHLRTNPFLRELMEAFLQVAGRRGKAGGPEIDFDELGVSDVVRLLDDANMEAVLRDFGDQNPEEDPVIHFYELFLTEYDPQERIKRGVFYTPRPVVSYIVRSVDELLRTEFGLPDGLADTTTWGEVVGRRTDLRVPKGLAPERDFVQILDPACGTGTFLVEVIDLVHKTLLHKWTTEGCGDDEITQRWNRYVPEHLLTRLHGYELLMAPYAIAHLKIGLKLYETGYRFGSDERARVFLTNSLEPASQGGQLSLEGFLPALAHEAQAVNEIKRAQRFTVVIGNPPYSVSSWNSGAWITGLVEDYKLTVRSEESQIQALSNDYIKFIRLGQWMLEQSGAGLFGMITGHGYLQGTQPRDLRKSLSLTFDRAFYLDLHGSIRRSAADAVDDEPVFQIMTGVAICVGWRFGLLGTEVRATGLASQASLVGPLTKKFGLLSSKTVRTLDGYSPWHSPGGPNYRFAPPAMAASVLSEYETFVDLPACFGTGNRQKDKEKYWATGFASQQDDLAISFTRDEVETKMKALAGSSSFGHLQQSYRLCTTDQWDYEDAREFARRGAWRSHVAKVLYRPFDHRWSVLDKNVLTILRTHVMSELGESRERIGLVVSRAVNDIDFAHCFVADGPVDKIFISSKTSTNAYVFPISFQTDDLYGRHYRPNLSRPFLDRLSQALGTGDIDAATGFPTGVHAEDVFNYLYAILFSPRYRARYGELLKTDFPRLPLPGSATLFDAVARLGDRLLALHLMEPGTIDRNVTTYDGPPSPEVVRVGWSDTTVWLDAPVRKKGELSSPGRIGFHGVPEAVWNFHVGGYQVLDKWLKDRKGRMLSEADIAHYQKVVVALSETIRLMGQIDDVIEAHGGWPGAFQTNKA